MHSRNPFIELVGAELIEWSPGECVWKLEVRDCHGNPQGGLHGGVMATLLDVACAYSGAALKADGGGQRPATLSLSLQFIAKAGSGTLLARGRRTGGGRRIYFAEAQLLDEEDKLVATATGTFCMQSPHMENSHADSSPETELIDT
ncbi:PaaI family thioesterase [Halomonas mongoliensis]|uniref:PaaI family thioesterase n=1 Tax=Halomonas mongoliensis TaxID=321265 RepID=UPI00403AD4CB